MRLDPVLGVFHDARTMSSYDSAAHSTALHEQTREHFTYRGEQLTEISFPLGGIGSGCIGLGGNGRLIDWEIFGRPNKGSVNGFSHFAVKAERDGKLLDADSHPVRDILRVESPMQPGPTLVPVERYFSKDFHDLEVEKIWRRVW